MQTRPDTPEPHEQTSSSLTTLEYVAHCWNYSRLLRLNLSGIVLGPPKACHVTATICYCPDDHETVEVLREFGRLTIPNVRWNWLPLDAPRLCRRAIGRNLAGLASSADHVLFVDVDYVFCGGALDNLARDLDQVAVEGPYLAYCQHLRSSVSHEAGDAEILRAEPGKIVPLYGPRFEPAKLTRAIGGSQYVLGSWIRAHGYLPNTRWQKPVKIWKRTHEDKIFRAASGLRIVPLDCPQVHRIRHSKRGRFDVGCQL